MEKLLSVEELAEKLSVPKSWIYSKVRERKIPFRKLSKYLRFSPSEIEAWVNEQKNGQ